MVWIKSCDDCGNHSGITTHEKVPVMCQTWTRVWRTRLSGVLCNIYMPIHPPHQLYNWEQTRFIPLGSDLSEIVQKENAPQISCSGPRAQSVKLLHFPSSDLLHTKIFPIAFIKPKTMWIKHTYMLEKLPSRVPVCSQLDFPSGPCTDLWVDKVFW